jgi:hypothetical protein
MRRAKMHKAQTQAGKQLPMAQLLAAVDAVAQNSTNTENQTTIARRRQTPACKSQTSDSRKLAAYGRLKNNFHCFAMFEFT